MRIWLRIAPLAPGYKNAGGGAFDNCNLQGIYLRNRKFCPNKLGDFWRRGISKLPFSETNFIHLRSTHFSRASIRLRAGSTKSRLLERSE